MRIIFLYVAAIAKARSSHPEVFLRKGILKTCNKFTGEHHAEVWFQESCFATLLKLHFGMGVLLYIWCMFSEHLFLETSLSGSFWKSNVVLPENQVLIEDVNARDWKGNALKNVSVALQESGKYNYTFLIFHLLKLGGFIIYKVQVMSYELWVASSFLRVAK